MPEVDQDFNFVYDDKFVRSKKRAVTRRVALKLVSKVKVSRHGIPFQLWDDVSAAGQLRTYHRV